MHCSVCYTQFICDSLERNTLYILLTVAGSVDPVEAEVYPEPCQHPGGGGVPGQGVEAVVLVDVEICTTNMRRHKRSECFHTTIMC